MASEQQRSTRVLAHPDGSFTVECLLEAQVQDPRSPLSIPRTVKRWAQDPGFAAQPGLVGQHRDIHIANARAQMLSICSDEAMYAEIVTERWRREDDPQPLRVQ